MNFKQWLLKEENNNLEKQIHIFDFDDTIAITKKPDMVMLYKDGRPAHKSEKSVSNWIKKIGLKNKDILKGPNGKSIEFIPSREGYAFYVSSNGLKKIKSNYHNKEITGIEKPNKFGLNIVIDVTPSFSVDSINAIPIKKTIDKIKKLNASGAETIVVTARKGKGKDKSIYGHDVEVSNERDIANFLNKHGATPTKGVIGVNGENKGKVIYNKLIKNKEPKEIHFYDNLPKNINNVSQEIGGKIKKDLYLYGPGNFKNNQVNVNKPSKIIKSG